MSSLGKSSQLVFDILQENQLRRVLRILLIVDKFGGESHYLDSEVKLQKIEFFFRNPDHFSYFLLKRYEEGKITDCEDLKKIINELMNTNELDIRIDPMKRYKYGAYEELDKTLSILSSLQYMIIDKKGHHLKCNLTENGINYIENLKNEEELSWYFKRVNLLYTFLEKLSPTEIKKAQYQSEIYSSTEWNDIIPNEIENVKNLYKKLFGEELICNEK